MYKVAWDISTNGVILTENATGIDEILLPRPVFFEELDLLGFNNYWQYPKAETPLLWANGRRYYYKGKKIAEAKRGNIFEPPQLFIEENSNGLSLEPVNVELMLEKNSGALRVLENEAMDFVGHTYKSYRKGRNKVDCFAVSFSGGKDSQVVLDIVSRVIPPDEYIVVFTDTDMELPSTYETVQETEKYYKKLYPELRFFTAKGKLSSAESWQKFGPPSRIHRWCCTVHKTAPYMSLINSITKNGKRQPKILTFEGVRADESARRSGYARISEGFKHIRQINSRVIKDWNSTEVFLYIFYRSLPINCEYRYGLNRVGCSICPFGSEWSDYLINRRYPDLASKYIDTIKNFVKQLGIIEDVDIMKYIADREWKKRAGGLGIGTNNSRLEFFQNKSDIKAIITRPRENFMEWIKTTGDLFYKRSDTGFLGEIKIKDELTKFELVHNNDTQVVNFEGVSNNVILLSKLKKILNKSLYCVHCGACEIECPTGALKINPNIKIDIKLCTHCGNCIDIADKGCLVAKSLTEPSNDSANIRRVGMKISGVDRYKTFGLRKEWLRSFLNSEDKWFEINPLSLGNKQKDSARVWFYESELIDKSKQITKTGNVLKNVIIKNEQIVWQIIWINLSYNSELVKWYIADINFGSYSIKELTTIIAVKSSSQRTAYNGVKALANLLENCPIGYDIKMGIVEEIKNTRYIKKIGTDDIHPIAIAYALFRYAEAKSSRYLTVSELYREDCNGGPYKLFGISRERLENILRYLQEDKNGVLKVDLSKGLDNIRLRDDLNHIDVLELLSRELL